MNTTQTTSLDQRIASITGAETNDLGISEQDAQLLMTTIEDSGRSDETAMRAYDLLYNRVMVGRAW